MESSVAIAEGTTNSADYSRMAASFFKPRWYAVYTNANHEKRVAEQLRQRSVEHLLPLYRSVRRWKDRRVKLELPLFRGYVFVRLALCDRLQVLQVPGVAKLVGFSGRPTALPDKEIETLKKWMVSGVRAEPHVLLHVGGRVRVVRGPMEGVEGILVRKKNLYRVVLTLDLIARSAAVEVDSADIERIL